MPVHRGRDSSGSFYRWGQRGKKYYYTTNSQNSRDNAKEKALRQGRATKANRG